MDIKIIYNIYYKNFDPHPTHSLSQCKQFVFPIPIPDNLRRGFQDRLTLTTMATVEAVA